MKKWRRLIGCILIVVMLASDVQMVAFADTNSNSRQEENVYTSMWFEGKMLSYDQYKAEYYLNSGLYDFIMSDEFNLPYRTVVERNRNSWVYMSLLTAWEAATFEPKNLAVGATQKRIGFYEAFLFDILYNGYEPTNATETLEGVVKATQASMVKKLANAFEEEYYENYWEMPIGKMEASKWENMQQAIGECEEIQDVMGAIGNIGKISKYASDVEDLLYKLAKAQTISQMSLEKAKVLENIAVNTQDEVLSAACLELATICKKQLTEGEMIALFTSELGATELANYALDELWEVFLDKVTGYGLSISAGQETGKWLTGLLFLTDKEVENFYEMSALYIFEYEMWKSVQNYAQNFKYSGTEADAKLFNASYEMLLNTLSLACDLSIEHLEIVNGASDDGGVVRLFVSTISGDYEKFLRLKKTLNNIAKILESTISYTKNDMYHLYRELFCGEIAEGINMPQGEDVAQEEDVNIMLAELNTDIFLASDIKLTNGMTLTQDVETFEDLYLSGGILNLNGHTLKVSGNLYQTGGIVKINGGTLEVEGDYRLQGQYENENGETEYAGTTGCLQMESDKDLVKIHGSFYNQSETAYAKYENIFSAGVMEIGGDFYQNSSYWTYDDNFNATGSHKVILNGEGIQNIIFATSSASHFNILELTKDKATGYRFSSDDCWNILQIP